jgi:hypothetical protein
MVAANGRIAARFSAPGELSSLRGVKLRMLQTANYRRFR